MTTYEFDHVGRASRGARSPQVGLDDALSRLSTHTYGCMACLRHVAGYGNVRCAVARHIDGQVKVFRGAIERNGQG